MDPTLNSALPCHGMLGFPPHTAQEAEAVNRAGLGPAGPHRRAGDRVPQVAWLLTAAGRPPRPAPQARCRNAEAVA